MKQNYIKKFPKNHKFKFTDRMTIVNEPIDAKKIKEKIQMKRMSCNRRKEKSPYIDEVNNFFRSL